MKKAMLFMTFLVLLLICSGSTAEKDLTAGDWVYEVLDTHGDSPSVRINKYKPVNDPPEVLVVPEQLGGYPVKEIYFYAFSDVYQERKDGSTVQLTGPKALVLPAGLEKIEGGSIWFSDLEEIRIENGSKFETVDGVLFEINTHTLVIYPRGKKGSKYIVPEGTLAIESGAFDTPENLTEIVLAKTIRWIKEDAFDVFGLHLTIQENVETIESGAVNWADQFISYSSRYQVINGMLIDTEEKRLISVPASISYRDEKTRIINIPEGVEIIADGAFCSVYCGKVIFPSTLKRIDNNNQINTANPGSVSFPEGLEYIGDWFEISNVKKLDFPSTLNYIGMRSFCNVNSLKSIIFREGLKSIGSYSFCENKNLTSVMFPCSLKSFGRSYSTYNVFEDCPKLCAVVVPNSDAEKFCRSTMTPYRYFFDRLWSAESAEAEEFFSISCADQVGIRMDKKSLELIYTQDVSQHRKAFSVEWKQGRLNIENESMEYFIVDESHLTLKANEKELHLTRIEDRK